METTCSHCRKNFNIADDQLHGLKTNIVLACPECNEDIEIDLKSIEKVIKLSKLSLVFGEKLKKKILNEVNDLPPMPQVAMKARQIVSDPNANYTELAKVIETDQAIATRVLKLANSAFYCSAGEVSTIHRAAVVLGTKSLHKLLTLACSSSLLGNRLMGYELDAGDMWMHSLAVASGSGLIARKYNPELEDDAFSAGLIHDAGKLILDPYIQGRKHVFAELLEDGKVSFLEAERKALGFDHAEIASEVCEKWKIPSTVSNAIKYHHRPSDAAEKDLALIVHVADSIALMSGVGSGIDGMLYEIDEAAMNHLGIAESDFNNIMYETAKYVRDVTQEAA